MLFKILLLAIIILAFLHFVMKNKLSKFYQKTKVLYSPKKDNNNFYGEAGFGEFDDISNYQNDKLNINLMALNNVPLTAKIKSNPRSERTRIVHCDQNVDIIVGNCEGCCPTSVFNQSNGVSCCDGVGLTFLGTSVI